MAIFVFGCFGESDANSIDGWTYSSDTNKKGKVDHFDN